ncbi:MAG: deoxyribose-phosphate aldolase [Lactobacillus sp.]|jgi:deoxyribose-phosphate aldolase|nr:deoxyribose-phosphate aldolase [Lactobacillus sp.]
MDDITAAQMLIRFIDLTSLSGKENNSDINKLCDKAEQNNVAAVCVYPKFISQAHKRLRNSDIKVATVINFPDPDNDLVKLSKDIRETLKAGADELDIVFPYHHFLEGYTNTCDEFLATCRKEVPTDKTLKIILETGEIKKTSSIIEACRLCIKHQVDFIKTSTGKTETSATPEVANIILETINQSKSPTGFKASGGIKTFEDARKYLVLTNAVMGPKWATPDTFRIGASSLLDDLLNIIDRGY